MSNQLDPFEVGQLKARREHGFSCTTISKKIFKADGETNFLEACGDIFTESPPKRQIVSCKAISALRKRFF